MPLKEGFSDKTLSFGEKQNTRKLISQYTHCLSLLKIREKNINKLDSLPSVSAHKGNFYSKQCWKSDSLTCVMKDSPKFEGIQ